MRCVCPPLAQGLAEAIKMGCIRKPALFSLLEANPEKIMRLDPTLIQEVPPHLPPGCPPGAKSSARA